MSRGTRNKGGRPAVLKPEHLDILRAPAQEKPVCTLEEFRQRFAEQKRRGSEWVLAAQGLAGGGDRAPETPTREAYGFGSVAAAALWLHRHASG